MSECGFEVKGGMQTHTLDTCVDNLKRTAQALRNLNKARAMVKGGY